MAKTLSLPFARTKKLDPRINFSRASTGGYYGADGLYRLASNHESRFDHDPVTGESKGLLIEEQRTNLLTYSESFDNAAWVNNNSKEAANVTLAPDGTLTADKLIEDTGVLQHNLEQSFAFSATTYTLSVFAKAAERSIVYVAENSTGSARRAFFSLSSVAVGTLSSGVTGTIQSVGNGWYRCSATFTASAASSFIRIGCTNADAVIDYTGDGTSGIYIWGAQLEVGSFQTSYIPSADSFTSRASSATFIGSNGLIQSAATNVARYNYNPLNLTLAPKLLLEEQRTNLLTYSEQFDNAAWATSNASVSANAVASPSGAVDADKLVENTATSTHRLVATGVSLTAGSYASSIYIKSAERTTCAVTLWNATDGDRGVNVNLATGVVSSAVGTIQGSSVTSVGGGWYRVSFTCTCSGTASNVLGVYLNTFGPYTGDGTSGIYIWGAQLEQGSYPTSYIPTTSAQVTRAADVSTSAQATRAADVATMTGTNFSSWYNQSEGTLFAEFGTPSNYTSGFQTIYLLSDGTINNSIVPAMNSSADVINVEMRVAGSVVAGFYPAYTSGTSKLALAYKLNDVNYGKDGAVGTTDTSATTPVVSQLNLGTNYASVNSLNGHIKQLDYYNTRLPNAELQALTQPTSSYVPATLNLNFAQSKRLDPRVTFNRASTATYYGSNGTLKLAEANQPRFDYDPVTLQPKGLLIEEQRTNLLTYSEQFDNAIWSKWNTSVVSNATTAPDGTTTADKLVENTANQTHNVSQQSVTVTAGVVYTWSVYVKAAERTKCSVNLNPNNGAFTSAVVIADLSAGTITTGGSPESATISSVGNGWYRISITKAAAATTVGVPSVGPYTTSEVYTGDGTSGLYIWGAQLEVGAFPTSYIPTTSAQATRAADVATMTGTNFSSWWNATEGSIYAEFDVAAPIDGSSGGTIWYAYSSSSDRIGLYNNTGWSPDRWHPVVITGGVVQADFGVISNGYITPTPNLTAKNAFAYGANNFATSWNGGAVGVDTSGAVPTFNNFFIGNYNGNSQLTGHIKRIAYFPKRLSNTELQALTS